MAWVDMGGGQWNWVGEVPTIIPELPALDFLATGLPLPPAVPVSPLEKVTSPGMTPGLQSQSLKDIYTSAFPPATQPPAGGGVGGGNGLGLLILLGLGSLAVSRMKGLRF